MNTPTLPTGTVAHADACGSFHRTLSWRAIFAGTLAGLAIHLLLTMLGLGLGMGSLEPMSGENSVAKLGTGAALAWCVSALIALFSGGWVAGRFAPATWKRSGCLHGFLVWSVAMVAVICLATSTIGMLIGGAAKVLGQAAKPVAAAASGVTDMAKQAVQQNSEALESFVTEAIESRGGDTSPGSETRAKREIGYALKQLFAPGAESTAQEKRQAVTQALTNAGVPEEQANRMLTEWTESYERMKADLQEAKAKAEQKAREVGEEASKAAASAAIWGFLAFLLGAVVASVGGSCGSRCNKPDDDRVSTT